MNSDLQKLQAYPFEKLAALKAQVTANPELAHIALSVGEPRHPAPEFVLDTLTQALNQVSHYPATKGILELRQAISTWAGHRFDLPEGALDPERHVLPVNGTREAIFALTQAVVDRSQGGYVVMPNPFYQIYEGACYLAGATPYFLDTPAEQNFLPDFEQVPAEVWQQTQMVFICTPGNPTGAVMPLEQLKRLIALADEYNFIIASDECYSEIYLDETQAPVGLLSACAALGRYDFKRCVVFHSLSKRSNLPGLRSGFVAGDAEIIQPFLLYRTYHGCAMAPYHQVASCVAWQDETHTQANRALYRQKFAAVTEILAPVLDFPTPQASFYLWPATPIADTDFAQALFAQQNITVLPGRYLSRLNPVTGKNPGEGRVRMALVATHEECLDAAWRIRRFVEAL
ncbi:N-succinyldiaminopimelate aminotransferase [Allopseudospirillum japonicum]|uniref:N-succinyldiaminopimelate aminotransferase n=1 Tax=Allopseudospirillum japonicum TaxID=64971 RepID=A0A1H6TV49_9GAMM|nr:succinyldiaminopimelate transaminase [Allopseudospirillum japonicum]SEI79632.1 N-succinyldiaminopimelate aminotransferase [Allopseudospirillum japonicum]